MPLPHHVHMLEWVRTVVSCEACWFRSSGIIQPAVQTGNAGSWETWLVLMSLAHSKPQLKLRASEGPPGLWSIQTVISQDRSFHTPPLFLPHSCIHFLSSSKETQHLLSHFCKEKNEKERFLKSLREIWDREYRLKASVWTGTGSPHWAGHTHQLLLPSHTY